MVASLYPFIPEWNSSQQHWWPACYTSIICKKQYSATWRRHIQKTLLDLNTIFKNRDLHYPPTKPPTRTNAPRVKVQSKDPTIVPRMKIHSNDTNRVPRVQPLADTTSTQQTLIRSKRIRKLSKPIVSHNADSIIHLSVLEENLISDMMNINTILGPTTGYILELCQLLETPGAKLWRDGSSKI